MKTYVTITKSWKPLFIQINWNGMVLSMGISEGRDFQCWSAESPDQLQHVVDALKEAGADSVELYEQVQ